MRTARLGSAVALVLGGLVLACGGRAAREPELAYTPGTPWVGERGITETVEQIMARQAAADAVVGPRLPVTVRPFRPVPVDGVQASEPGAVAAASWPTMGAHGQGAVQGAERAPQGVGVNVLGATSAESGFFPPDTMGCVGPTQFVIWLNGRIRTLNKATGAQDGALNTDGNTFFNSVRNGSNAVDPRVWFDRTSNRWFLSCINVTTPNRVMIAVSSGPNITSAASFTFFFFQMDTVGTTPNSDTGGLCDYESLGVDANAVYIAGNIFNASGTALIGVTGFVVQKASLISGGPIVVTAFRQIAVGSSGIQTAMGVSNDDPAATEGYFIGTSNVLGRLVMRRVLNPGGAPSISGDINIATPLATARPFNVTVSGSTSTVDALDDRLFNAKICTNSLTGSHTLWTSHSNRVNSAGASTAGGDRDGTRWYEIGSLTTTPSVVQSGTLFDNAGASPKSMWMGSVAMSMQGHMAVGATFAGTADRLGVVVAGRLSGDAPGATQAANLIVPGVSTYNAGLQSGRYRWGDYSQTSVDPADGMSLWTIQEYCSATNQWGARVLKLLAPPPATPVSCSPSVITQGDTIPVTVTGLSALGSGFFDPPAALPNHISASLSGAGLTINSVTFNSPTSLTVSVTAAPNAALGASDITVVNPDGQSASSSGGVLTVQAPPPPACLGDINNDGLRNTADLVVLLGNFGLAVPANTLGDLDGDGFVGTPDLVILLGSFGVPCPS